MQSPVSRDARAAGSAAPRWARRAADRLGAWISVARRDEDALPEGLLDALPDPVVVVDDADRVRAVNRAASDAFGLGADALVGEELGDMLFARAHRSAYRTLLDARAGSAEPTAEAGESDRLAVVHADGSEVAVEVTVRPIGSDGLLAVTLRALGPADPAREAASEAADARRRTLHTILDALPDAVVAVDREGAVVFRNRASAQTDSAQPLPDAERRAADAVMRSGTPAVGEETRADGSARLTTRIPVRGASGTVVGLVALSRDVTAHKADVARLLDEKRAAEAAARATGETLATTSHEVRTLMSGVTGMTQLLLDTDLSADQRDFVDTIRNSSSALLRVVNDVLDLSKMDAGMLELESEPFRLAAVVDAALATVAQQAGAKSVALDSDLGDDVPEVVVGDPGRIQQVLANLLTNAVKFTDDGAVRVSVSAALAPPHGEPEAGTLALRFAVEDTGVGIDPKRLEAVFEPFAQADASTARTHGGTGLGLSICRRLVGMMGGDLTAESVPGGGSVFQFTVLVDVPAEAEAPDAGDLAALSIFVDETPPPAPEPASGPTPSADSPAEAPLTPVAPPASADALPPPDHPAPVLTDAALPAPPPAAADESGPSRPRRQRVMEMDTMLPSARVLLVEDDPVMQKVTAHTLSRLGYRPTVVSNGRQGVLAVRARPYDVVLMDIMMPVMDGLEATRQVRTDWGPHPEPAVVMLTANAMKGDRDRGYEAGCDAYLTKPVDPRELAATIERCIRSRKDSEAPEAAAA